jgi:hypothetical protein
MTVTPDQQFLVEFGVNATVAIATLAAVVVTLFGNKLRPNPRLKLQVRSLAGEKTRLTGSSVRRR